MTKALLAIALIAAANDVSVRPAFEDSTACVVIRGKRGVRLVVTADLESATVALYGPGYRIRFAGIDWSDGMCAQVTHMRDGKIVSERHWQWRKRKR